MAFVTLRFHYTIFHRQIQHIFEIFGTLRYKSTRSIRHKSHKPTFTKTFYRQSYDFFVRRNISRKSAGLCSAGARRVLAAPKRAKRRQAAASPQSAARTAARAPWRGCTIPADLREKHYPNDRGVLLCSGYWQETKSRVPADESCPHEAGTLPQAMPFRRTSRLSQSPTPLPPRQTPQI